MGFKFNTLLRAILAGSGGAQWEGVTLSLSVTADSGVAPTTTCSGTAPFGVVFDLTASTALTGDAFHDYVYFFDFGDGAAETYTYGQLAGLTKNKFVGAPLMAYTYLTAGTYAPRVWASNGVSAVGPITGSVTVNNPDTVYGNANTWYIHDTTLPVAGADGVPVGATNLVAQSDFSVMMGGAGNIMASNRRFRFRAGRTWTSTVSRAVNNLQGVTFDTYEPTPTGTYATISGNFTTGNATFQPNPNTIANNPDKWRMKNIHWTRNNSLDCTFTGSISGTVLTVSAVTTGAITVGQRTQYNGMAGTVTISSFGTGTGGTGTYNLSSSAGTVASSPMATTTTVCTGFVYGTQSETSNMRDFIKGRLTAYNCKFSYLTAHSIGGVGYGCVYDKCWVDGNASGAAYLTGAPSTFPSSFNRYAIVDSKIDAKNSGEHAIRVQGGDYLVLVSNEAANPGSTKAFITVRGWTTTGDLATPARWGNVSYNYINGSAATESSPWATQLAPQNATSRENIKDYIWSNNFYHLPSSTVIALHISARNVTVRNNVVYSVATSAGITPWSVYYDNTASPTPADTPQYVNFYDNTAYAPTSTLFSLLNTTANTSLTTFRGNLGYAPLAVKDGSNSGSAPTIVASGSAGTSNTVTNNCTDGQIKNTDPLWVGPSTTMAGYAIQSGSYAKNAGVDLLVRTDGVNKLRNGSNFDLGAMNAPDKQVDAWTLIP